MDWMDWSSPRSPSCRSGDDEEPGWIVTLPGPARALAGRHATEFEAMAAAAAALWPGWRSWKGSWLSRSASSSPDPDGGQDA